MIALELRSSGPDCRNSRVPGSADRSRNFSDFCKAECNCTRPKTSRTTSSRAEDERGWGRL